MKVGRPLWLFTVGRASLAVAFGVAAGGCTASPSAAGIDSGIFVAFASDFDGFHDWPHRASPAVPSPNLPPVDAGGVAPDGAVTDGGVHPSPQAEYWNRSPPHGSTSFPLGTIIVKETEEVDPTARQVFALVKRGGDFDPTGAVDWEWFDLTNDTDGSVVINWHGYGPPTGSASIYGGNPSVCNSCHLEAAANDCVWSEALQLSNF
jgi:hypothetical protein